MKCACMCVSGWGRNFIESSKSSWVILTLHCPIHDEWTLPQGLEYFLFWPRAGVGVITPLSPGTLAGRIWHALASSAWSYDGARPRISVGGLEDRIAEPRGRPPSIPVPTLTIAFALKRRSLFGASAF